jgi:putative acetyltransferase
MDQDFALLLYQGHTPIACGSLRDKGGGTCELKRVFLQKEFRGKGLGRKLLLGILAWAKDNGVRRIILETGEILQAANKLYRSLGFQRVANYPPYEDLPESICMALEL